MPAGVNSTEGSQVGTSTSLGLRVCPFDSKKARYFSRISSVFMALKRCVAKGLIVKDSEKGDFRLRERLVVGTLRVPSARYLDPGIVAIPGLRPETAHGVCLLL